MLPLLQAVRLVLQSALLNLLEAIDHLLVGFSTRSVPPFGLVVARWRRVVFRDHKSFVGMLFLTLPRHRKR